MNEVSKAVPTLPYALETEQIFTEDFDGDLSQWNWDDLIVSAEHRTHSNYLDPVTGEVDEGQPWNKVPMRHAALYTAEHRDKCQYIENGQLVMKGHYVENPLVTYRDNYVDAVDPNLIHRYGDYELHGGWLSSKERFTKGCVIEVKVNLEAQCMRGHRFSIWLVATNGKMYLQTVQFCEIDLLEAENATNVPGYAFGNRGLMKIVGGGAKDTPNGLVDFDREDLKINLREGWHTITLVWHDNGSLDFICDGLLCNRDDRTMNTPPDGVDMEAQLILSDEMTSGVKNPDGLSWQNKSTGPRMPEDSGLFGQSVILDVPPDENGVSLMDKHKVYVDYIRSWKIIGEPKKPEATCYEVDSLKSQVAALTLEKVELLQRLDKGREAFKTLQEL